MVTVNVKTTVHMPEIPGQVVLKEGSTMRDLLLKLLQNLPIASEIIDRATGEIKIEGLFEVSLNGVSRNSLQEDDATELHDGDQVTLSLILLGGG